MSRPTRRTSKPKKDKYVIDTFVPEVSRDEQSAAFKIFHVRYLCRIANVHTETLTAMMSRQPRGNEFGAEGRRYAQELRPVYLTIASMAELMLEGATIHLSETGKAKEIYLTVKQHLQDWCRHVDLSINRREIPEDDLRALDMFAAVIYPYARHDIETSNSENLLSQLFARQSARSGLFRRHTPEQQKEIDARARGYTETPLQHSSLMDSLANPPESVVKSKWT